MKVAVVGLSHLGTVIAACLASGGHEVTGIDFDADVVAGLAAARPPLFEPGLEGLVRDGLAARLLTFTGDPGAVARADVVWIAFDTPVDDEDRADVEFVMAGAERVLPHVRDGSLILLSSQVPAGTTRRLEDVFARGANGRTVGFGYSPENLRLGAAIDAFTRPDRVVVGLRRTGDQQAVLELLRPFTERIEWMSVESAEMTKHALNAFLATSVAFANELGALCEQVGADATELERGLKSDARIGPKAYLSPGAAFAGGTLARDLVFLADLGRTAGTPALLLSSVKASNDAHRRWPQRRIEQLLGSLAGRTVGIWGLTYKPGTDTLRRSSAVELGDWLHARGARVRAYDPAVRVLPAGLSNRILLEPDALAAVDRADALVVATPWPEYRLIPAESIVERMARPLVLDASRFLASTVGRHPRVEYVSVGRVGR